MKTSYFISLTAADWGEDYKVQAGMMANVFVDILSDSTKIASITKNVELSKCHSEVDVGLDESKLVGRAVIEFEAENRVNLDKTKLSQMMRSIAPWSRCKVEKRTIDTYTLEEAEATVVA